MSEVSHVTIPTSEADRKKIKMALTEMTRVMRRIEDERISKKDIADKIKTDYGIPLKTINKLASTMYKQNYADVQAEMEDFELLYETLVEPRRSEVE